MIFPLAILTRLDYFTVAEVVLEDVNSRRMFPSSSFLAG